MDDDGNATQASYDQVAAEYARHINDELRHKPLERQLLNAFAARVEGCICDVGCGPGHVAAYLSEHGADVLGVDLSANMISQARELHPGVDFQRADMRALPLADGALGGIVALYSLIHIPRADIATVLGEFWRALRPGGELLVSFHIGTEVRHMSEWWGEVVNLDFVFFQPTEMASYMTNAGFALDEVIEREPYPEVEAQTRRAYLIAHKPASWSLSALPLRGLLRHHQLRQPEGAAHALISRRQASGRERQRR